MMQGLRERWEALSERDRRVALVGGIAVALLLGYTLLWSPAFAALDALRTAVAGQRREVRWAQPAAARIQALRAAGFEVQGLGNASLLAVVDRSLRDADLESFVTQVKQAEDGKVAVTFNTVPFDTLVQWLAALWKRHGIAVGDAAIRPAQKTGLVQATLTLEAP